MLQTGLPLNHAPKHSQKLVGDISWVIGIRKDTAVGYGHVADEVENDTLCPDGVLVLSPVGRNGPECSNIKGVVGFQ
jgi:hypothetical protein